MNLSLEQWGVIANIIISLLTSLTVFLSYLNLKEMKRAREESSRPYVIVGYKADKKRFIHLYIKNIGLSPAKNVEVKIKEPIMIKNGTDARKLLFDKPIKYLVPNQEIKTVVFPSWEIPKENGKYADNCVSITYDDASTLKQYSEETEINVASELNILYFKEKTMDDLVKAIKELNKDE